MLTLTLWIALIGAVLLRIELGRYVVLRQRGQRLRLRNVKWNSESELESQSCWSDSAPSMTVDDLYLDWDSLVI
jgi:hypothetical protein